MEETFLSDLSDSVPLKKRLLHSGFWMYTFTALIAPAGYIIKLLVSQSLSVEEIGVVYTIISFISLISAYNDLGLTESLQYFLPQYIIDKEYAKAKAIVVFTRGIQFLSALLIGCILYFGSDRLATHYFKRPTAALVLKMYCLYFLCVNLFQVLTAVFNALQEVKIVNFLECMRVWVICLLTGIFFWAQEITFYRFSSFWIVSVGICLLIALFIAYKKYPWLHTGPRAPLTWGLTKKRFHYALRSFLGINIGTLFGQLFQQVTIVWLGAQAAGYWTNFLTMQGIIFLLIGPMSNYLFPLLTELIKKKSFEKIALLQKYLYAGIIVFGVFVGIAGRFFGAKVTTLLLGEKFLSSGQLFMYFCPFALFFIAATLNSSLISGTGGVQKRVKMLGIALAIGVIFCLISIPRRGLYGVLVAQIVSYIYLAIHSHFILQRAYLSHRSS